MGRGNRHRNALLPVSGQLEGRSRTSDHWPEIRAAGDAAFRHSACLHCRIDRKRLAESLTNRIRPQRKLRSARGLCAWSRSAPKPDFKIAASLVGTHLVPDSPMRQPLLGDTQIARTVALERTLAYWWAPVTILIAWASHRLLIWAAHRQRQTRTTCLRKHQPCRSLGGQSRSTRGLPASFAE